MKQGKIFTISTLFLFLMIQALSAQHQMHSEGTPGEVNFETTCDAEAQEKFNHGLVMLHHMMYDQAEDIFEEALHADANCKIAHWGIAMTQLNPLWAPATEEKIDKGWEAIKKADGASSDNEQAHISALRTYYETAREDGYREGLKAWERELEKVYQNHPDDINAGAFYGLSMLATASPDDESFSKQREAGALLEELFAEAPEHPGLYHYIIHAYDNPILADNGVRFAHEYDKLAPNVPHALHMPSHIFVRIGNWDETIDWNRRSADAALEQPVGDYTSMHHAHALDYMMYGYLQKGQDRKAKEVLDELSSIDNYQPHLGSAYGIAAANARYAMERRDWESATTLNSQDYNFPWENFPQFEAIFEWANGLAATKVGNLNDARENVDALRDLHQKTLDNGEDYWALLVDVQRKTVEAWILHEEGMHDDALALMREAADQEDSVDKNPVTPSEVLPARELLGDMLMLHEMPEEALSAYEAALEISPNRFHSLYGAGSAANMAGNEETATKYFTMLSEFVTTEESDRPELEQVALYLNGK